MPQSILAYLAFSGVTTLIAFLAYGSQILFYFIEPNVLRPRQAFLFNGIVVCIWVTYFRACFTDPGYVPSGWPNEGGAISETGLLKSKLRWCRKCEAFKPPRAHHCKVCRRCIPKMDHHCPWTINCVSHRTFPHFLRFLFYSVVSMLYLKYFLYIRAAVIWDRRNLPSYLGPTLTQMILLFLFSTINSLTLFVLSILLVRNIWCLASNVTTIEGWEIERHETLARRARKLGGYLHGPDGIKVRIKKQEFPYDIGIYRNMKQAMGEAPMLWLWPFCATPSSRSGLNFETNGFEDASLTWPPPDPDRIPKYSFPQPDDQAFIHENGLMSDRGRMDAIRERQQEDLKRFNGEPSHMMRYRSDWRKNAASHTRDKDYDQCSSDPSDSNDNGKGWRDSEGDTLDDFGVDEDDIPLAVLQGLRREASERLS